MKTSYDAVLFDFDGVLADTEPIHWRCWVETLGPLPIDLSWEIYAANCIGVQDWNMLPFLASIAASPIDAKALEPFFNTKKQIFQKRIEEKNPITSETVDFLRSLSGFRLGVVTSSDQLEVEPLLERAGIRDILSVTVFGGDVARHKPDPEPYLLAASRLNATSPLVVEDSVTGVTSARAANFEVIHAPNSAAVPALVWSALGLSVTTKSIK